MTAVLPAYDYPPLPALDLPLCTTERLLVVADLIETRPEAYNQMMWYEDDDDTDPILGEVVGRGMRCGAVACIAGWGVALTPRPLLEGTTWLEAGASALGLSRSLARYLFSGDLGVAVPVVADMLRRLATLDPEARTLRNAHDVLTSLQYRRLMNADPVGNDD